MSELKPKNILAEKFSRKGESTLFPVHPIDRIRWDITGQKRSQALRRVFIYANPSKPQTHACLKELTAILESWDIQTFVYSKFSPSQADLYQYVRHSLDISRAALAPPTEPEEYHGDHDKDFQKDTEEDSKKDSEESFTELNNRPIFDLVITVGGDGTVLKYLACSPFREIPILPINTGSLGYITSISFDNMAQSIQKIFSGAFVYSSRLLLKAQLLDIYQNPKHSQDYFALNEIAISSCRAGLLAEMELQVGNSSIPLQGDGIVVATPTGSTAYSLAAGGPIVDAEMDALIITPVSPFSLATRPVVTPGNVNLFVRNTPQPHNTIKPQRMAMRQRSQRFSEELFEELHELESSEAPLSVAIDGRALGELFPGESIYVTGSTKRVQFLAMSHNNSYFENIRTKLGWHNVSPATGKYHSL
ncbi:MAG: NAD(+)/NADH kinase [Spirochaetota bacterium]